MPMKKNVPVPAEGITGPITTPATKKNKRKVHTHASKATPHVPRLNGFTPQQSAVAAKLMLEIQSRGYTKAQALEQTLVGMRAIASVI